MADIHNTHQTLNAPNDNKVHVHMRVYKDKTGGQDVDADLVLYDSSGPFLTLRVDSRQERDHHVELLEHAVNLLRSLDLKYGTTEEAYGGFFDKL